MIHFGQNMSKNKKTLYPSSAKPQPDYTMKTNALKIVLFLIGALTISIASSAQSSDSLYCSPIWNIRKLTAIAQRVPVLDSLVDAQIAEINRLNSIVIGDDIILKARVKQIGLLIDEKTKLNELNSIQVKLTDQEKRDKRQWKGIAIVLGVLCLVQVFY